MSSSPFVLPPERRETFLVELGNAIPNLVRTFEIIKNLTNDEFDPHKEEQQPQPNNNNDY